jgi:hypothetical protein
VRVIVIPLLLLAALQAEPPGKFRKAHKAHQHGTANLNIAIEGNSAVVELDAPAEGFLGFEHEARTAAQKKQQETALQTLRTRGGELVRFPPASGCQTATVRAEVERHPGEEHAEVEAEYRVTCTGELAGAVLRFGISRMFPKVREVKVQVLSGTQQTGITVINDRGTVQLAP